MYLFSTGKVISAIGKCRRILVTVHATTDAIYTTTLCLQKRYQPVNEAIKEIQSRFNMSCCPMFITSISITIDSINERFPCTQRSAQKSFRRRDKFRDSQRAQNARRIPQRSFNRSKNDRKDVAKKLSITHADEARPSTSNAIRAYPNSSSLLQCNPRRGSEDNNRQATTSIKRCCTSRQWHQEVWLSRLMHQELHWLDIPERVKYKLGITHRCLLGKAPVYLSNCCIPVAQVATRRRLRSADRASTSSQHVRPAGICCSWSDDIQRSARWCTRSHSQQNNIRTIDEDTSFLCLSARLAH